MKNIKISFGTRKRFFYSNPKIENYNLCRPTLWNLVQDPLNVAPSAPSQCLLSQSIDHFREREGIV
jgi:hypothetical protein